MPFCRECGYEIKQDAKFCIRCGHKTEQAENNQRQQEWAGKIIKCPFCGEAVPSFTSNCPTCGYEIREMRVSYAVSEFAHKLELIDLQYADSKAENKKQDPNILYERDKKKIELIRSFPIPNSKEDLLELLTLTSANIDTESVDGWNSLTKYEKALSNAWKSKYEQTYLKAQLSFADSPDMLKQIREYNRKYNSRIKTQRAKTVLVYTISFAFVLICFVLIFGHINKEDGIIAEENARLKDIESEVVTCIEIGDYNRARILTLQLVFNVESNIARASESEEKWDDRREELLEIIDDAEKKASG